MLSQVKKIIDPTGRKHVAGRLGAWWDGRDYAPEPDAEEEAVAAVANGAAGDAPAQATAEQSAPAKPPIPVADAATDGARIAALERMWGVGRFGPHTCEIEIIEQLVAEILADGDVGMMGADPAMLRTWTERSGRNLYASEWRSGALERVRRATPDITVINDDVDRAKAFPDDALAALASINTMSFADHKAGLVSRAFHVLKDGGRWVILDTVRTTAKTPPQAFASAWAEPQLAEEAEIDALLAKAGFGEIRKQNMTAQVIETARAHMAELGAALETTVAEGMSGADGVLFLRELVWELKSWRARLKALEGGALQVVMWSMLKGGTPGPAEDKPDEAGAAASETSAVLAALEDMASLDPVPGNAEAAPADDISDLDEALFGSDD